MQCFSRAIFALFCFVILFIIGYNTKGAHIFLHIQLLIYTDPSPQNLHPISQTIQIDIYIYQYSK